MFPDKASDDLMHLHLEDRSHPRDRSLPDLETWASAPRLVSARVEGLGSFDPAVGVAGIVELLLHMHFVGRDAYNRAWGGQ